VLGHGNVELVNSTMVKPNQRIKEDKWNFFLGNQLQDLRIRV